MHQASGLPPRDLNTASRAQPGSPTNPDVTQEPTTLVLFTTTFPFGRGEEFIETEVEYLAKRFKTVVVVPNNASTRIRPMPPNAVLDRGLCDLGPLTVTEAMGATAVGRSDVLRELGCILSAPPHVIPHRLREHFAAWARAKRVVSWLRLRFPTQPARTVFYTYWFDVATVGLAIAYRKTAVPMVTRAHGYDVYEDRRRSCSIPFRRLALDAISEVHCVSDHGRHYLARRYPAHAGKLLTSRLGVGKAPSQARASEDGVFRIVSCSYMTPVKRLPLLLDALEELATTLDRTISWVHIGDGPMRVELEARTRRLPASVGVTLTGHLPNDAVKEFYATSPIDAFVNVSASEGVPVSIMEAQSFGIPVVACAVGGVPEIVNDNNGSLLPQGATAEDVARGLASLMDAEVNRRLRKKSAENWATHYDAETNYELFTGHLHNHLRNTDRASKAVSDSARS